MKMSHYDEEGNYIVVSPLKYEAHPMTHIEDGVDIGEGTIIRQFATVSRGAIIGENCSVAPGASVDGAILGDNVNVGAWVSLPIGWKIDDDVFIGPSVMFVNDMNPSQHKDGYDLEGKLVGLVRKGASIGCGSIMMAGVIVGENSLVAAGSVVNRDVPPNCLWTREGKIKPLLDTPRMRFIYDEEN